VRSAVSINEPLFEPLPPELVFRGYQPFKQYEATVCLRNNDQVGNGKTFNAGIIKSN